MGYLIGAGTTPADNTVATAKIQDDAVTLAKMARFKMVNNERVQLTQAEEDARDSEEAAWEAIKPVRAFSKLRGLRDQLLSESDWWGAADQGEMSSDRVSYRKALRDLPAQYDNSSILGEITWPSKP